MALGKLFKRKESEDSAEVAQEETVHTGELEKAAYKGDDHEPQTIDPVLEKRVVRKLDRHIVPLVMTLCMPFSNTSSTKNVNPNF
jgi:hypothetical protein